MLKRLASDTAIYGIPSIVGRLLNVLLVPLHTYILDLPEYGVVQLLYAAIPLIFALLIFRLETTFFRFGTREFSTARVFDTAFGTLLLTTPILTVLLCFFAEDIALWLLSDGSLASLIYLTAGIILFDVLCEIPYARLRLQNRAWTFSGIRMANIGVNILLNLFFLLLCPWLLTVLAPGGTLFAWIDAIYDPELAFQYIFFANLAASISAFLLLLWVNYRPAREVDPEADAPGFPEIEWTVLRPMLVYAAPLVVAGLAGIANETLDRILLNFLLPLGSEEAIKAEVGVYGACYKIAMFMALFTQAYRYAAEPVFFREAKNTDAPTKYAQMTEYFAIVGAAGFLIISLFVDLFAIIIAEEFRVGLGIVPIILLANLMLGLYYNAAVWFKVTDRTGYGAAFAVVGAVVTVALNWMLIPAIGIYGSAWATLACYTVMLALCYVFGQKFYPVPYRGGRILTYAGSAIALYLLVRYSSEYLTLEALPYYVLSAVAVVVWGLLTYRLVAHPRSVG